MSNFKTTVITAVTGLGVSLAGLFFIPEAKAVECVEGNGYSMCFDHVSSNGSYNKWNVMVRNSYTDEMMTVTCNGNYVSDWSSQGGFSQSEAQYLADYFCSL